MLYKSAQSHHDLGQFGVEDIPASRPRHYIWSFNVAHTAPYSDAEPHWYLAGLLLDLSILGHMVHLPQATFMNIHPQQSLLP